MAESIITSFETAVTDANFAMCFYRMPFQNNIGNVTQHPSKTRPRNPLSMASAIRIAEAGSNQRCLVSLGFGSAILGSHSKT